MIEVLGIANRFDDELNKNYTKMNVKVHNFLHLPTSKPHPNPKLLRLCSPKVACRGILTELTLAIAGSRTLAHATVLAASVLRHGAGLLRCVEAAVWMEGT